MCIFALSNHGYCTFTHWGSEYQTSLVFKRLKVVWLPNCPVFKCPLNTRLDSLQYSTNGWMAVIFDVTRFLVQSPFYCLFVAIIVKTHLQFLYQINENSSIRGPKSIKLPKVNKRWIIQAWIAQLVAYQLGTTEVVGSNPGKGKDFSKKIWIWMLTKKF